MTTKPRQESRSVLKLASKLAMLSVLMFAFGYALVPLYNVLCKQLGINGKTDGQQSEFVGNVDESRVITVEFLSNRNESLPWNFFPATHEVKLHPGEMKRVAYYAENTTNHDMTVQAIPSVSPGLAAKYLKKTECFCFTQQTLHGHEGRDMPVFFHLDPAIPKYIKRISLSYTLFDVGNKEVKSKKPQGRLS